MKVHGTEEVGLCHCKATPSSLKGDHSGWERFLRTGEKQISVLPSRRTKNQKIGQLASSGKVMGQIIMKAVSKYKKDKKVTGSSQHEGEIMPEVR